MAARSADDGENLPSQKCLIHVNSRAKGSIITFKDKSWEKFTQCCVRWRNIDSQERDIAKESLERIGLSIDTIHSEGLSFESVPKSFGYHRECYQYFCNVRKIQEAEKRKRKNSEDQGTV